VFRIVSKHKLIFRGGHGELVAKVTLVPVNWNAGGVVVTRIG